MDRQPVQLPCEDHEDKDKGEWAREADGEPLGPWHLCMPTEGSV